MVEGTESAPCVTASCAIGGVSGSRRRTHTTPRMVGHATRQAHEPTERPSRHRSSSELEFETESEQTQLARARCKESGCTEPVIGSSITCTGHVCARHNEIEWGRSLTANRDEYYRNLGGDLLRRATR